MNVTCLCCGYITLDERGKYEICPICFWEDDLVQTLEPTYEGGANKPSLKQAQKNFIEFGACERRLLPSVRKPEKSDRKDIHWKPFEFLPYHKDTLKIPDYLKEKAKNEGWIRD